MAKHETVKQLQIHAIISRLSRISDVMRKQAPYLKLYSEYTNNYKHAIQMFEECLRKKRSFEEIVRRIEVRNYRKSFNFPNCFSNCRNANIFRLFHT